MIKRQFFLHFLAVFHTKTLRTARSTNFATLQLGNGRTLFGSSTLSCPGTVLGIDIVRNSANVRNIAKISGHIPDIKFHCPERDQKSWNYTGQTFALSRIWPKILALFRTNICIVWKVTRNPGHVPDIAGTI